MIEDWWQEWQIELVNDRTKNWQKKKYVPEKGFWIERDGKRLLGKLSQHESVPKDAIIVDSAWEHEHCALCMTKIMEGKDYVNDGFTDGDNWICPECFDKYMTPQEKK